MKSIIVKNNIRIISVDENCFFCCKCTLSILRLLTFLLSIFPCHKQYNSMSGYEKTSLWLCMQCPLVARVGGFLIL